MAQQNPRPGIGETFRVYFNDWLSRKQILLDQLLLAIESQNSHKIDQHKNLIDLVLAHSRDYFEEKSKAANEDVFLFLSPEWFTSFERTLLWLGEFKPSAIFRLVNSSVKNLTEEQSASIEIVKFQTRRQERELSETLARVQENFEFGEKGWEVG
ncbi:unnamed protein product [Dovyalis caffra]|uniref:DOG1 domain-containing protein n=1 Tax=Dovyalis caffra TaxID=77055 RepID=A0AAV1S9Z8_9ROSI|nr:unnamed protein product [Dovyalis caffra]